MKTFDTMKSTLQERENTMTKYVITGSREVLYEFEIEAESEGLAIAEAKRLALSEGAEEYAYDWLPLDIIDVTDLEEQN
jgi:hypothetical protein